MRERRPAVGHEPAATRVLVVSASMGAGHNGAANELARRLRERGHSVEVRDFLDAVPLRLGAMFRRSYEVQMRAGARLYDWIYRVWFVAPWLAPLLSWFICLATRRRIRRWVRASEAQVVVSTYPLSTLSLGRMRSIGWLKVPAVNYITDFGVHPLWVHRGIDLNLAVHPAAADSARALSHRASRACGPLIGPDFDGDPAHRTREATRSWLGLRPDDRAVLVVAGSLCIGDIDKTFADVLSSGRYVPVAVCGRDDAMRVRLEQIAAETGARAVVLGWTDRMPELMGACDALVENAGGRTSLEAFRVGLPVVSFEPIAGHGRHNTATMARAGVSLLATDPADLDSCLQKVTAAGGAHDALVRAGRSLFAGAGDAEALVLDTVAAKDSRALAAPSKARIAWAATTRAATAVGAAAAIGWAGMTTGVGVAAAAGAGVAHPPAGNGPVAYVGVRLDAAQLSSAAVADELRLLGVSAVIDWSTATRDKAAVRRLVAAGVDVESGGQGTWLLPDGQPVDPALWTQASRDATSGVLLSKLIGKPVRFLVPGSGVNAFDLIDTGRAHLQLVVAELQIRAATAVSPTAVQPVPTAGEIVLVNGKGATPGQLVASLRALGGDLAAASLSALPLGALS